MQREYPCGYVQNVFINLLMNLEEIPAEDRYSLTERDRAETQKIGESRKYGKDRTFEDTYLLREVQRKEKQSDLWWEKQLEYNAKEDGVFNKSVEKQRHLNA